MDLVLSKVGGLIQVINVADPVINSKIYMIQSSDAKYKMRRGVNDPDNEPVTIEIGGEVYILENFTHLTLQDTPVVDLADYLARITQVFPEEGSGSGPTLNGYWYGLLTQDKSNSAPTADVISSNLGIVGLAFQSEGEYTFQAAGKFPDIDKILINGISLSSDQPIAGIPLTVDGQGIRGYVIFTYQDDTTIVITCYDIDGTKVNVGFFKLGIKLEIFA